jgi:hypothetical protein
MQVHAGAHDTTPIASLPETLAAVAQRLQQEQTTWLQCLQHDPSRLAEVERAVHHTFQQLADAVVAGLLGAVGPTPALEQASKKSP